MVVTEFLLQISQIRRRVRLENRLPHHSHCDLSILMCVLGGLDYFLILSLKT